MPTVTYFQEIVGKKIECECGYESDYIDYDGYASKFTNTKKDWTCPKCGKTGRLHEEFV